jgi:hypothetical protein
MLRCSSDNMAAVSWTHKGSTYSSGRNAHLLRLLAPLSQVGLFQLQTKFVSGPTNTSADFCSCSYVPSDANFLQALNPKFPIPLCWTLVPPPNANVSPMISALCKKLLPWASLTHKARRATPPGSSGVTFANPFALTQSLPTSTIRPLSSKCSPINIKKGKYFPTTLWRTAKQWETPFVPLCKCSHNWANPIPNPHHPGNSPSDLRDNS